MPDNNRKVLSVNVIKELNNYYKFNYDEKNDKIEVSLINMNRTTSHDADKPFSINAVKLNKKVMFNLMDIYFWKEFQKDRSLASFSLFDIHNAINKLKITYQNVDKKSLINTLINNYNKIN